MAKTTVTHITDDIDGSKDATQVAFSFNGAEYTIDLGIRNVAAMEKALKPYVDAATKVAGRGGSSTSRRKRLTGSGGSRKDLAKIREWARAQGLQVAERGRISASVIEQYQAAN